MDKSDGFLPCSSDEGSRVSVCVAATHPVVLGELQKILESNSFHTIPIKLAFESAPSAPIELPIASMYVIDSAGIPSEALEIVHQIVRQTTKAGIVVLAEGFDEHNAFPLLNAGVKGLIAHEFMVQQLPRALQSLAGGGFWVPRILLAKFVDSVIGKDKELKGVKLGEIDLSRREREIVDGLLLNLSNKEIGNRLNISERTVKFHVSNLLVKFNVQRRADLILLCYQSVQTSAERDLLPTPQISWRLN
jgi:DNA-binding NarL/FixJ family response regulator